MLPRLARPGGMYSSLPDPPAWSSRNSVALSGALISLPDGVPIIISVIPSLSLYFDQSSSSLTIPPLIMIFCRSGSTNVSENSWLLKSSVGWAGSSSSPASFCLFHFTVTFMAMLSGRGGGGEERYAIGYCCPPTDRSRHIYKSNTTYYFKILQLFHNTILK